jgi:MoaA/NifB/PqqE/SkfB family radical SAM enzyme
MSCEPGKGEDMSMSTFRKALSIATDHGEYVTLGGGEPTVHPQFERMLLEAIAEQGVEKVHVITNGKIKRRALMLAALAKKDVISAEMSTDPYHEPYDQEVYEAFDGRYRDITHGGDRYPLVVGRGADLVGLDFGDVEEDCCCDDWIVNPDGTISQCGCPNAPIVGNVDDGILRKYRLASGMCHRSNEFADVKEAEEEEAAAA